jgi:hypothetical protein
LDHNTYKTIQEALDNSFPGDTIILSQGHYWVNCLDIGIPIRFISDNYSDVFRNRKGKYFDDTKDNSKYVIELSGQIQIRNVSNSVVFLGITIRRPRKIPEARSCIFIDNSKASVIVK